MDCTEIFICKQCGQCCEGRGGIILSKNDLSRLVSFLKLPSEVVIEKYTEMSNGKLKIKTGRDGKCIFFESEKGCAVHDGKPNICRAWPFFRGNLTDPASLGMAKEFCPGIDNEVAFEEFCRIGIEWLNEQGLIASDSANEANALIIDTSPETS